MKKTLFIIMLLGMTQGIIAQPQARRQQAQQKAQQSNANNMTARAQISFPTAAPMDEDVVWRRDIYRELDLNEDANAGLYYPVEPIGNQMNLFTSIFRLMMTGKINVYQYRMDGNESGCFYHRSVFFSNCWYCQPGFPNSSDGCLGRNAGSF